MDLKERIMKKRVLVVDDEGGIVESLKVRLEAAGYEVLTAGDGQAALDKVRAEQPDLIILDILMPKIDGYEVCRLLKFDKRYKDIPIIMLTAKTQDSDKETGMEVGADEYMGKPFDSQVLLRKIKELLKEQT